MEIKIMRNIMSANQKLAKGNRKHFLENKVLAVNIMASPGAGKTSIIMKLIEGLRDEIKIHVVEGDISSSIDAEKIDKMGISVMQINTDGGCHLDANMIKDAIQTLNVNEKALFLIENVGNLVCPSTFDLGESLKIVVASVPEGHDKPFKYTSMFESADIIVLSKKDLLPYIDFDMDSFVKGVRAVNEKAVIIETSITTGEGIEELFEQIRARYI